MAGPPSPTGASFSPAVPSPAIVWMLPVVQGLIVPGFAGLKKQGIAASAFGQRIETHHQAHAELRAVAEGMREHSHQPVRRVDAIVAAPGADIGVTRKDRAVDHEHIVSKHEHASVHRGGIGQPTCA